MDQQEKWRTKLDIKWNTAGDSCSKEFFEFNSKHRSARHIKEINWNGTLTKDPQEIEQTMMEFYTDLYTKAEEVDANAVARTRCLISVPRVVIEEQNRLLVQEVTMDEVKQATTFQ